MKVRVTGCILQQHQQLMWDCQQIIRELQLLTGAGGGGSNASSVSEMAILGRNCVDILAALPQERECREEEKAGEEKEGRKGQKGRDSMG